jgi:hypothetical protein
MMVANGEQGFIETMCESCGRLLIVKDDDCVPLILCPTCGGGSVCAAFDSNAAAESLRPHEGLRHLRDAVANYLTDGGTRTTFGGSGYRGKLIQAWKDACESLGDATIVRAKSEE